jgi:survival-of-motor-neuron-related-splicing factor 30
MTDILSLENDKREYQEQLDLIGSQLRDRPDDPVLLELEKELKDALDLVNESIAELKPVQASEPAAPALAAVKASTKPPEPEKWSRENHPAFKNTAVKDKPQSAAITYRVNDSVIAQWKHGDGRYYPAKITSITGSSTDPVYIVKFTGYDETESLTANDMRPQNQKRKADGPVSSASPALPAPAAPGVVSSAGATMYPDAKKSADNSADPAKPPKAKKIKANRELEAGKSKWQEFNTKSKFGKSQKKDSMFRTPEGVNGRVGFTGSGQAMRKDPTRSRHVYQQTEEWD